MKKYFKIIICGLLISIFITCTSTKLSMNNQFHIYCDQKQIDSICLVENIPYFETDYWKSASYIDWETENEIKQYFFIIDRDTIQYVYTVTDLDSLYQFKKRVTKKIKK